MKPAKKVKVAYKAIAGRRGPKAKPNPELHALLVNHYLVGATLTTASQLRADLTARINAALGFEG